MRGNRYGGGPPNCGGGGETKSPQERYDVIFSGIFSETLFYDRRCSYIERVCPHCQ